MTPIRTDREFPDSPMADSYVISLAVRRRALKARTRPAAATVLHYVGSGIEARLTHPRFKKWRERWPEAAKSPFHAALWVYTHASLNCGHYLVGGQGECVQTVPEDLIARHVGRAGAWRYTLPRWATTRTAWWHHEWPKLKSPRDLAGGQLWRGWSCNANTYGIEVAEWTQAARARVALLVIELHDRRRIPCERAYLPRHCDVHPVKRTLKNGRPFDPREEQWVWDRFVDIAGASD